ncbi:hypothetical protein QTP88_008460 [Uroleucon formosanum]
MDHLMPAYFFALVPLLSIDRFFTFGLYKKLCELRVWTPPPYKYNSKDNNNNNTIIVYTHPSFVGSWLSGV